MMRRLLPRVRHLLAVPLPDAPAAGAGEAASPPGRAVVPVTIVAARAAPQVLVVEDDPDILETMLVMVQMAFPAARVLAAADGHEAAAHLQAGTPDVVVTDFRLPGPDGLHLARMARSRPRPMPVVLVSAFDDAGLDEAVEAGLVTARLRKPFDFEDLVHAVEAAIEGMGTATAGARASQA